MAQTSWPFAGVDATETMYSRLLRHIISNGRSGVNGVPGDNNLKVYADSSGMKVKVKVSGGNSQAIIRGHMYNSTAEETLTIAAASINPRIDSIVLTLDPTTDSIALAVVQGTASGTPSAPSLTQTDTSIYQFKLADVLVAANATTIDASAVTDKRQFIQDVWTTGTRPEAYLGAFGYNTTINRLEVYNGTAWVDVQPSTISASQVTDQTSLNAGKVNGSRFTVSQTAPATPSIGDIWFW